jgi:hypothetical protein
VFTVCVLKVTRLLPATADDVANNIVVYSVKEERDLTSSHHKWPPDKETVEQYSLPRGLTRVLPTKAPVTMPEYSPRSNSEFLGRQIYFGVNIC